MYHKDLIGISALGIGQYKDAWRPTQYRCDGSYWSKVAHMYGPGTDKKMCIFNAMSRPERFLPNLEEPREVTLEDVEYILGPVEALALVALDLSNEP
jgi:hypothetical protein